MKIETNTYEEYADRYAELLEADEHTGLSFYHKLIVPELLNFTGELNGKHVLDAGCGEGYISRELRKRGADVIGIDISPKLIDYARDRSKDLDIEYLVYDLSKPLPERLKGSFDLVVSNLVIDDVPDYVGFVANLGWLTKPSGRVVLSKNNPYSAVIRGKVDNYFETGTAVLYKGLSTSGVRVYYFHRTLEEYVAEFSKAGYYMTRLSDLRPSQEMMDSRIEQDYERYMKYYNFPFLMVLEFMKAN